MTRIAASVFVLSIATLAAAQPQFEVVDLTKQFGSGFSARTINNNGVIAGSMFIDFVTTQACIIENGVLTMLPKYQGKHDWYAIDINDNGDVLGGMELGGTTHTVLYRNGKVINTGLQGSEFTAAGRGLNNLGQGAGTTPVGIPQAFVWENGATTVLPGLGTGSNVANVLNDAGTVAGSSQVGAPGSSNHAANWVNGKVVDLHPAWASDSMAVSINSNGNLAGWARAIAGGQQGAVWQGENVIQLPNFGGGQSRAYDINNSSQVVGWAADSIGRTVGFLWDNGSMHQLEDLIPGGSGFVFLQTAFSINNDSQVLLRGFTGSSNPYLLLNPVPEPGTSVGVGIAIFLHFLCRRGRSAARSS
jgi:probable HAF family extracellular repeat protein